MHEGRTFRATRLLAALSCLSWLCIAPGCVDEGLGEGADSAGHAGFNPSSKSDDQAETGSSVDPIDGGYRFELVSEVTTREEGGVFTSPSEETSTTRLSGVVTVSGRDAELTFSVRFCGIELPEVSGYVPEVEEATLRGLAPMMIPGQRFYGSDGTTTFESEPAAWVVGAELADPLAEDLPMASDDARIVDVDDDGEPGVTMMLGSWKIYGAMRLLFQLQGQVEDEGVLTGNAEVTMDTAVYGDTVPLVNVATKIASMREDTTVVAEKHVFTLNRLSLGEVSCEQAFDGAPIDEAPVQPRSTVSDLGGACESDANCQGASSVCLAEVSGFPGGHCSEPCEGLCPDPTGDDPAICTPMAEQGAWCVLGCQTPDSTEGCREGYRCVASELYGESGTMAYVCLPDSTVEPEPREPDVTEPTDPERTDPNPVADCMAELVERGIGFEPSANPMESPEGYPEFVCDVKDAVFIDGTIEGVNFRYAQPTADITRIFGSCELALAMHDMAQLAKAQGVSDIVHLGAYNCRLIAGSTKLSQHGYGTAIDVAGVAFDDGTYWTVYKDWEDGVPSPLTEAGAWWLDFATQLHMQWIFNIVLTPEYDGYHDDHLHLDLTPGEHMFE